jgi:4-hydroxybenzoate polyprenyltransferase
MPSVLVHLRLHFQLLLAPVFLWGWLLAGGGVSQGVVLAFIALHVFLYSGATAFNSYYDRDEGPVGGLERPPPVSPALLPLALGMKVVGAVLAALVNPAFLAVYLTFAGLSLAYSHPWTRLKAHTWASLLTVAFGQGVLAYLGAWAAVTGGLPHHHAMTNEFLLGAAAASLSIVGVYPLTQLYQVDEDRGRGDRTVAVAWGASACFAIALAGVIGGGATIVVLMARRFGAVDATILSVGLALQALGIAALAWRYDASQIIANYRRVMRLNALASAALSTYFVVRLSV